MPKKLTQEEFIARAKEIHGDKYDYSKVEYVNSSTKVCIICPVHGEFWQIPNSHLLGYGCSKCGDVNKGSAHKSNTEEFIRKAKEVHGDKYDYSKVVYKNRDTRVCIICPIHGEFRQTPHNHLHGAGCYKCGRKVCSEKSKDTTETFIEKARKVHGDKYDYSKVNYINSQTKVCIICPKHGEFWQKSNNHIHGWGCKKCQTEKNTQATSSNTEEFIKKARLVHRDKYDYSKVEYTNTKTKVCIICPKHGEFWQLPGNHLHGWGCEKCSASHLEKEIYDFLRENKITFETEKAFDWLKYKKFLKIDFYLPDYNLAIECQGSQHYIPCNFGSKRLNSDMVFEIVKKRDNIKLEQCKEHNIKVIYFTHEVIKNATDTFFDISSLKEYLKNV